VPGCPACLESEKRARGNDIDKERMLLFCEYSAVGMGSLCECVCVDLCV